MNLSRTLTVPEPTTVTPTVWVRARQGPNLADLISAPGSARATGDADPIDVLGSAYAATDGDPGTAWTAPQNVVQHKTPPTLTVKLPTRREVAAVRVTPSSSELPAHPTLVAVDLGDGPQVRRLAGDAGPQTLDLNPRVTDTVKLSILDWDDVIDRTALGFDQLKPPGLAEVDGAGHPGCADRRGRRRAQSDPRHRIALRPWADHRRCGPVRADLDHDDRRCAARRRSGARATVPGRADHVARGPAGVADQPRRRVLRRRCAARRPAGGSDTFGGNGSCAARRVERRPPRGHRRAVVGVAGAGRSRERQPRLDRADRRRHPADSGDGQRLAAGLGAATRDRGTRHAHLHVERASTASGSSAGWRCCPCSRCWPSCRCADASTRMSPRGRGSPGRWPRAPRRWPSVRSISGVAGVVVVGAALGVRYLLRNREKLCDAVTVASDRGRADPGRGRAQPESVAIGRRIRRPLRGGAVARSRSRWRMLAASVVRNRSRFKRGPRA